MPIDANDAPAGFKAVAEIRTGQCAGCALDRTPWCATAPCTASERPDETPVIFVPADEPCTLAIPRLEGNTMASRNHQIDAMRLAQFTVRHLSQTFPTSCQGCNAVGYYAKGPDGESGKQVQDHNPGCPYTLAVAVLADDGK